MSKARRSPVLGYNHNVRYHGRIFHIQTEDSFPINPHIFTHLFYEGTILSSKKQEYESEAAEDSVRSLMQAQHKAMMKELKQGIYDGKIEAFFAARGEEAVLAEPETAVAEGPGAASTRALDLDAIPAAPGEAPPPPITPAPDAVPEAPLSPDAGRSGRQLSGAGMYTATVSRGDALHQDRPFDAPRAPVRPSGPQPVLAPAGGPRPAPPAPSAPAVAARPFEHPAMRRPQAPGGTAPVIILQPGAKRPAPRPVLARNAPSAEGVVVQRQVVVGGAAVPTPTVAPARPVGRPNRPVPYVLAGVNPAAPRRPPNIPGQRPAPTPAPTRQTSDLGTAPLRPAAPEAPRAEPAPENPFSADLISDKSLDDVILAYLSEDLGGGGEGK